MVTFGNRVKTHKLKRLYEAAKRDGTPERFYNDLAGLLASGSRKPSEFSIRSLFEHFVDGGREIVSSWGPSGTSPGDRSGVTLMEEGVDTGAFSNITGQIVYNEVMEAFSNPAFIAPQLAKTVVTSFLDGEKIAGISVVGDTGEKIGEGQPYPLVGVTEDYVETPRTDKNGLIVPVTKEAIISDRTGVLLERASSVSQSLAINKEKRVIDAVTGQTTIYKRKGNSIATYGDDSGTHDWDNLQASNALTDYTDVENALLLFDGLTDPNTAEPIVVSATHLLVPTALLMTARRIIRATGIEQGAISASVPRTLSANPLTGPSDQEGQQGQLQVLSNAYVKARTSSTTTWFIGDPIKAFRYMEVWPITAVQAPPNSELEFTHDIVQRYKVSERGAAAAIEPRYMVKNTA